MSGQLDYSKLCPGCQIPIGDHTIRGYGDCLTKAGFNYDLPFEEIPGGPIPGLPGSQLVGEITVGAAVIDTAIGAMPALQFIFTGAGDEPMSRRTLPPIVLIMDSAGLKRVRQLVATSVDNAILAARRKRR